MFEWTVSLAEQGGYVGIFLAMALENIFPPIPSELVMIFAGAAASGGGLNIFGVVVVAAIGSVAGLVPWYFLGKMYGLERLVRFADRHGRWLTFSGKDLLTAQEWFVRHGKKITIVARALPGVRTFVAIPAAIMKMGPWTFFLFAFIGSLIYDGIFGALGYFLGENQESVLGWIDIATYVGIACAGAWYLYRVYTFNIKK